MNVLRRSVVLAGAVVLGSGCQAASTGAVTAAGGPSGTALERVAKEVWIRDARRSARRARARAVLADAERRLEQTLWVRPGNTAAPPCTGAQLGPGTAGFQGATQTLLGGAGLINRSSRDCTVRGAPSVRLLTRAGAAIPTVQRPLDLEELGPMPWPGRPVVALRPGQSTTVWLQWENDCSGLVARSVRIRVGGGSIVVPIRGPDGPAARAPCPLGGHGHPSWLDVGIFTPEQRGS